MTLVIDDDAFVKTLLKHKIGFDEKLHLEFTRLVLTAYFDKVTLASVSVDEIFHAMDIVTNVMYIYQVKCLSERINLQDRLDYVAKSLLE